MAAKRLSMRKIRAILRLRHERGLTHRTIAEAVRVGAATVSEYLAKATAKGLGWPLPEELSDAKLEQVLCPRPASSSERKVSGLRRDSRGAAAASGADAVATVGGVRRGQSGGVSLQPILRAVPSVEEETEADNAPTTSSGREDVRGLLGPKAPHRRSQDG